MYRSRTWLKKHKHGLPWRWSPCHSWTVWMYFPELVRGRAGGRKIQKVQQLEDRQNGVANKIKMRRKIKKTNWNSVDDIGHAWRNCSGTEEVHLCVFKSFETKRRQFSVCARVCICVLPVELIWSVSQDSLKKRDFYQHENSEGGHHESVCGSLSHKRQRENPQYKGLIAVEATSVSLSAYHFNQVEFQQRLEATELELLWYLLLSLCLSVCELPHSHLCALCCLPIMFVW